MVVDIDKIMIRDRIRKDFGDIQELADDIKQNGLINPPVINKEYVLLAGERRLKACKSLGWSQIEVRMMDTRDAEHELNVEISENENRKEFSKSERVDYMKRLLRIEQAKAKERMSDGGKGSEISRTLRSDDEVARQFDISSNTLRKELTIVGNKELLSPSDFADWDEGKLSTNKAFQKIKEQLKAKDEENAALRKAKSEREMELVMEKQDLERQLEEARSKKAETVPADYEELKEKASHADGYKRDYDRLYKQYDEMAEKWKAVDREKRELEERMNQPDKEFEDRIHYNTLGLCAAVKDFIQSYGGYVWLTDYMGQMQEFDKQGYIKAAEAMYSWASTLINNIKGVNENG